MPRLPSDSPALCALAKFASAQSLVFNRALSCLEGALLLVSGASCKIRVPKAPLRLLVEGAKLPQETGYVSAAELLAVPNLTNNLCDGLTAPGHLGTV